ncbi:MAG TPA: hypothetical protein VK929_17290 [Longimicrobiales bacterium]|nr:hypothetical protein [Longimicrobiales bacterium]
MMEQAQWMIAAQSRLQQQVGGAELTYPGQLATCPRGHVRVLPTRFSQPEFMLWCDHCGRSYLYRHSS